MLLLCLFALRPALAQTPQFVSFASAQPVLYAMPNSLPPELKASLTADTWNKWVRDRGQGNSQPHRRGRGRDAHEFVAAGRDLHQGSAHHLRGPENYGQSNAVDSIADKRADDLVKALAAPHPSEGMLEMRALLERKGFSLKTPDGQKKVKGLPAGQPGALARRCRPRPGAGQDQSLPGLQRPRHLHRQQSLSRLHASSCT